jgi:hypothetical protein
MLLAVTSKKKGAPTVVETTVDFGNLLPYMLENR